MGMEEDPSIWFATRARLFFVVDAGPDRKRNIRRDRASTRSAARARRPMVSAYPNRLPLASGANQRHIRAGLLACPGQAAGSEATSSDPGCRRGRLLCVDATR